MRTAEVNNGRTIAVSGTASFWCSNDEDFVWVFAPNSNSERGVVDLMISLSLFETLAPRKCTRNMINAFRSAIHANSNSARSLTFSVLLFEIRARVRASNDNKLKNKMRNEPSRPVTEITRTRVGLVCRWAKRRPDGRGCASCATSMWGHKTRVALMIFTLFRFLRLLSNKNMIS